MDRGRDSMLSARLAITVTAVVAGLSLCAWWLADGPPGETAPTTAGLPDPGVARVVPIDAWLAHDEQAALRVPALLDDGSGLSAALEARLWALVDGLAAQPWPDAQATLDRPSLRSVPEVAGLRALGLEHVGLFAEERQAALAGGLSGSRAGQLARETLAARGDDLVHAWCSAMGGLRHPLVLGSLMIAEPLAFRGEPRLLEAWLTALRTSLAAGREDLACLAVGAALKTAARQDSDPHPIWATVIAADRPRVTMEMFLWLSQLPIERVEHLLLLGLRSDDARVRFGAMECVRDFGTRGELDTRLYAGELVRIALAGPDTALLYLEAIAALGEADPVLTRLVDPATPRALRELAAASFVLGVEPELGLEWTERWLSEPGLLEAGLAALGVLPGPQADALLHRTAERVSDGPILARVLQAMTGRGPGFLRHHLRALSDGRPEVTDAAVQGLLVMVAEGHAADPTVAGQVTEGLERAALEDPREATRQRALIGLALQGGSGALEVLERRLAAAPDASDRGLSAALLVLASRGDAQRLARLRSRTEGDSLLVRAGFDHMVDTLQDDQGRSAWQDQLRERTALARLAGELDAAPPGIKDPFAWERNLGAALEQALASWEGHDRR